MLFLCLPQLIIGNYYTKLVEFFQSFLYNSNEVISLITINATEKKRIDLGRRGEQRAREVLFDITHWAEIYGQGEAHVYAQRYNDANPYPVEITQNDTTVSWVITSVDNDHPGYGQCELVYVTDDRVVKSVIYQTYTHVSLSDPVSPPNAPLTLEVVKQEVDNISTTVKEFTENVSTISNDLVAKMKYITDVVNNFVYAPISILDISSSVEVLEVGDVLREVVISWELSNEPDSITLDGEPVDATKRSQELTGLYYNSNKTFTLVVIDELGRKSSASVLVKFLSGVYYGALSFDNEITSDDINGLNKNLSDSHSLTFTAHAEGNQRIVYALPKRFGTPNFNVCGLDGGFELYKVIPHTNVFGHVEDYQVWVSVNEGLGSTTVKVT